MTLYWLVFLSILIMCKTLPANKKKHKMTNWPSYTSFTTSVIW